MCFLFPVSSVIWLQYQYCGFLTSLSGINLTLQIDSTVRPQFQQSSVASLVCKVLHQHMKRRSRLTTWTCPAYCEAKVASGQKQKMGLNLGCPRNKRIKRKESVSSGKSQTLIKVFSWVECQRVSFQNRFTYIKYTSKDFHRLISAWTFSMLGVANGSVALLAEQEHLAVNRKHFWLIKHDHFNFTSTSSHSNIWDKNRIVVSLEGQISLRNHLQCLLIHYQKSRHQHRQMIGQHPGVIDPASSFASSPRTRGKAQPPQIKRLGMEKKILGQWQKPTGKKVSHFTIKPFWLVRLSHLVSKLHWINLRFGQIRRPSLTVRNVGTNVDWSFAVQDWIKIARCKKHRL